MFFILSTFFIFGLFTPFGIKLVFLSYVSLKYCFTFSLKTIQKLETHFDEDGWDDEIPKEFLIPQPPKVDKKGLKKYLSDHPDVYMDAAELVKAPSLTIR